MVDRSRFNLTLNRLMLDILPIYRVLHAQVNSDRRQISRVVKVLSIDYCLVIISIARILTGVTPWPLETRSKG
jgi:hypothetical protein